MQTRSHTDGATVRRLSLLEPSRSSGATLTGQSDTTGTSGILLCGNFYDIATDLYTLRVYDRVLDEFDRLVNTRMDEERFLGSNVTWIVGLYSSPQEYGTPAGFGYGVARVDPGYAGFAFDVSGSLEEYSRSVAYPIDSFTRERLTASNSGTATAARQAAVPILASASADLRATLLWTVEYRYAATARTGGKVRAGGGAATNAVEEWCAPGTVVALTAVADSGYRFVRWTGGVPEGVDAASASIELPLDMGRTVYATFEETDHAPTTTIWKGGEAGVWGDAANWSADAVPGAGDTVVVTGGVSAVTITLDGPTAQLDALVVSNGVSSAAVTIQVAGWEIAIRAYDVVLGPRAKLTCDPCSGDYQFPTSRVWVVCTT